MRRYVLFLAAAGAITALVGAGQGGPVSATSPLPAKIEELEKAGELLTQGKGDEAFKMIQEACKKYPSLAPPRLILARLLLRGGAQQAKQVIELAASETPDHPDVYITMAALALNENRVSDLILNAQKVLDLAAAPRWTADQKMAFQKEARGALAAAYESRRDFVSARTQLAALLEIDPKNGQARQRFAAALFALDKVDEAFAEFQAASKDDSTLLPASVLMARQYMGKPDMVKASEYFDKASKQEPSNVRVHVAFADFLLQKGELEASKIHTEAAAKIDPKNVDVQQMQGLVARFGRDYRTAVAIFQEILNQSPANFLASNQLALIFCDMADDAAKKRGLQLAEVNARQYNTNIEALATLGYAYYRNGSIEQAGAVLQKILQGGRFTPDSAYYTALVLSEKKEGYDDAKKFLKGALDSQGNFFFKKEAKALYEKLEKEKPTPKEEKK